MSAPARHAEASGERLRQRLGIAVMRSVPGQVL